MVTQSKPILREKPDWLDNTNLRVKPLSSAEYVQFMTSLDNNIKRIRQEMNQFIKMGYTPDELILFWDWIQDDPIQVLPKSFFMETQNNADRQSISG